MHCRKELMDRKNGVENVHSYIPQETTSDQKSQCFTKRSIYNAIILLPANAKQKLFDCLRRKSFLFHVSDSESSSMLFLKCVELVFGLPHGPRRFLAGELDQSMAPNPDPGLAPTPIAALQKKSLAPASSASPSPSPGPSPSPSLTPSPTPLPPAEAPKKPPLRKKKVDPRPPPSPRKHSPPARPPPSNNNNNKQTIIIAVAATAVGSLAIIALILLCCLKRGCKKIDSDDRAKDDRPLLALLSSDFSAGIICPVYVVNSGIFKFFRIGLTTIL